MNRKMEAVKTEWLIKERQFAKYFFLLLFLSDVFFVYKN